MYSICLKYNFERKQWLLLSYKDADHSTRTETNYTWRFGRRNTIVGGFFQFHYLPSLNERPLSLVLQ